MHENRILSRIFGPKGDGNGEWRRLHNEELHSLYRSPNIVRVIKSRRLTWAGNVARMVEGRIRFYQRGTNREVTLMSNSFQQLFVHWRGSQQWLVCFTLNESRVRVSTLFN